MNASIGHSPPKLPTISVDFSCLRFDYLMVEEAGLQSSLGFFMIPNALMYWTGFDLWLIGSTSQEEKPVTTALKFGLICNNVRSRRSNVITGRAIVCCNLPSKHLADLRFELLTYVFGRQTLNPLQHDRF